jgi:hypothetical protein
MELRLCSQLQGQPTRPPRESLSTLDWMLGPWGLGGVHSH